MIPDADAASRALAAFESRRSPEGQFLSYCRGRSRHFLVRQMLTLFCFVVFLRLGDLHTALTALAIALFADGLESVALYRLRLRITRRGISRERLRLALGVTALMGGLQALSVDYFIVQLSDLGGEAARPFAIAVCLAALLDSALIFGLHRGAALVRIAVYTTTLAALLSGVLPNFANVDDRLFFDAMATLLLAHILLAFLRHVTGARKRSEAKQALVLETARALEAANDALRDSRDTTRRLATVAEQVGEPIMITDANGLITWVNTAFQRLWGYAPSEVIGHHVTVLNGPETDADAVRSLMEARREWRSARAQIVNYRKDGTTFWVETTLTPVFDAEGRIDSMVSVERDIGHMKEREEALARASRAAAETTRAKQAFLATVSHELRTPMNGIIGNAELLLDSPLDPEQRGMARTIADSAEALLHIVNDVLDLSALEAGRLSVLPAAFDPQAHAESVADLLRPMAERKGLRLTLDLPGAPPPRLVGDAGRLRQVLANLIGNAIKFTQTGEVSLRMSCRDEAGEAALRLEVRDTGIGIPPDRLAAVFDSFTQAGPDIAGRYGGTGLGLAISKQLVEAMGGTLTARSTVGRGSLFRIDLRLPLAEAEAGTGAGARAGAGAGDAAGVGRVEKPRDGSAQDGLHPPGGKRAPGLRPIAAPDALPPGRAHPGATGSRPVATGPRLPDVPRPGASNTRGRPGALPCANWRILVADDNAANLRLLAAMLKGTGAVVEFAIDGAEAVELHSTFRPDVVLMDMRMPRLDGPSATRAIRADEAAEDRPPIPVIALTANACPESRAECEAAGMTGFLGKPVRKAELLAALARLELPRSPPRSSAG